MTQYIGVTTAQNVISIKAELAATIVKEKPGMYASYCPALDLCSQGKTTKQAEKNIIEATQLFIEECINRGVLNQVLADCGFHSIHAKPKRKTLRKPPMQTADHIKQITVPAELPMMAY